MAKRDNFNEAAQSEFDESVISINRSLVPGSSCEFLTCCLDFLRLGSDFRAGVRIVRSAEVRCKFPDMGPEQVYGGVSE